VIRLDGMRVDEETVREPHRHDYHELIWVLSARASTSSTVSPCPSGSAR
jgi:hypothetical protein